MTDVAEFKSGYLDRAVSNLGEVLRQSEDRLQGVDFDTIVGTGLSGAIVVPALALRLEKKFVLVRKDTDDSHHGGGRLMGTLGERWIFVDDLIASGNTRERVIKKINDSIAKYCPVYGSSNCFVQNHKHPKLETTLVGTYLYGWADNRFVPNDNYDFTQEH